MQCRFSVLIFLAATACSPLSTEWKDGFETGLDAHIDTDGTFANPGGTNTGDNGYPVADAGPDFTQPAGLVVELDGSNSYDPDGDVLTFSWEFIDTPAASIATLLNSAYEDPSFYADAEGDYRIRLTVNDGQLTSDDEVVIDISPENLTPEADAGVDQWVNVGDLVQLSGVGSSDPEGDALNYEWTLTIKPGGSGASLIDATTAFPRFTADASGSYTIELRVDDGISTSLPDSVRVTAEEASDGDCLSCVTSLENEIQRQAAVGRINGAPALAFLPLLVAFWYRRND